MSIAHVVHTCVMFSFFFFNDTATTEIYTLSLHDALPISARHRADRRGRRAHADLRQRLPPRPHRGRPLPAQHEDAGRSEEHTSELQSRQYLVCRLLLEKKKKYAAPYAIHDHTCSILHTTH